MAEQTPTQEKDEDTLTSVDINRICTEVAHSGLCNGNPPMDDCYGCELKRKLRLLKKKQTFVFTPALLAEACEKLAEDKDLIFGIVGWVHTTTFNQNKEVFEKAAKLLRERK